MAKSRRFKQSLFFGAISAAILSVWACNGGSFSKQDPAAPPGISPAATPPPSQQPGQAGCTLAESGFGEPGPFKVQAELVVSGLEVPWEVLTLPGDPQNRDWLVSERPGRIRLVRQGQLVLAPVATITVGETGEGGVLGMALDPQFTKNSLFYVYYTASKPAGDVNRVERYRLSSDHLTATPDKILIDDIASGLFHNGGRIEFGPDGMLYIGTGDARQAEFSRDTSSPNGKILRISPDGTIPADNPEPGRPWFIKGVRNTEGFDWWDPTHLLVTDNGPTGEYLGRMGGDEVTLAQKGSDLGWPTIWHCETQDGLATPVLTWNEAVPPGGAHIYRGDEIPAWKGSLIIGTLGSEHLHRVALDPNGGARILSHEVYLQGQPPQGIGRIRAVFEGPAGELYVTTSNCDSRGTCPAGMDGIYRIRVASP